MHINVSVLELFKLYRPEQNILRIIKSICDF